MLAAEKVAGWLKHDRFGAALAESRQDEYSDYDQSESQSSNDGGAG